MFQPNTRGKAYFINEWDSVLTGVIYRRDKPTRQCQSTSNQDGLQTAYPQAILICQDTIDEKSAQKTNSKNLMILRLFNNSMKKTRASPA